MATVEEVTTQPSNFVDACEKGRLDDVRRMLHGRCDPNTRSSNRLFVLHLAANSGHTEVARLLLDLSATVDARDSADFTPMHYAAYHGHENVIDLLLERRADADAVGSNGSSPLHLASAGDHKAIAEKLIARGVDAGRRNLRHLSPADLARSEPMRSLLEQASQPATFDLTVTMRETQPTASTAAVTVTTTSDTATRTPSKRARRRTGQTAVVQTPPTPIPRSMPTADGYRMMTLTINTRATVQELRSAAMALFGVSPEDYQISFNDQVLTTDLQRIADLGIRAGSIVRLQNRDDLVAKLERITTQLEQAESRAQQAETRNSLTSAELLEQRARTQEAQANLLNAESRALRAEAAVARANAVLTSTESDLRSARAALSPVLVENQRLKDQQHVLERMVSDERGRVATLTEQLKERDLAIKSLELQLEEMTFERDQAMEGLQQQASQLELTQHLQFKARRASEKEGDDAALVATLHSSSPLASYTIPAAPVANTASTPELLQSCEQWRNIAMHMQQELVRMTEDALEERFMAQTCKSASDFEIVKVLGNGQNGIVTEARCTLPRHPKVNKSYALKICFNFDQDTLAASNAFVNEFVELAKLPRHPNILRFYCDFVDEIRDEIRVHLPDFAKAQSRIVSRGGQSRNRKTQFFVTEQLQTTLAKYLVDVHPPPGYVPESVVAKIVTDVASALLHLDRFRIAHRDIKLDNILVDLDDQDRTRIRRCVLGDFGTACELTENFTAPVNVAETGYVLSSSWGNPSHIAPELHTQVNVAVNARKRQLIDLDYSKQSIYELGVLVYNIVDGNGPIIDYPSSCTERSGAVVYSDKEIMEIQPNALDPALAQLVKRAVSFDPRNRPQLQEVYEAFKAKLGPVQFDVMAAIPAIRA